MIEFSSKSAKETIALGEKLAKKLDGGTVVDFYGGLGMGKTTIISGIAKGIVLTCNVSSPTFAIVNVYGEHNELCHFDMYRVESWDDLYSTGFFDYIDMGSVLCVEWSENVENAFRYSTLLCMAPSYDGTVFTPMADFIHRIKTKLFQNRRVALVENASWAPSAVKAMKSEFETMKNIDLIDNTVTIKTTLKENDIDALKSLADEILK